jgi:hypothetical protein
MKSLKTLSFGLLAAAGMTGAASAQTVVHFVGSTAFRAPDTAAMVDYLASSTTSHKVYAVYSDTTKNLLNSNATVLANGTLGGANPTATVIIETFWTGSAAGLVDLVAQNNTDAFIDYTNAAVQTALNASTVTTSPYGGGAGITGPATVNGSADVTFSDSYNVTISQELATGKLSAPVGSYGTIAALAAAVDGATVVNTGGTDTSTGAANAGFIGIVPFQWVVGNITTAGYTAPTNINQQAARSLIGTGFIPQSYLTGTANAADTANYFYLVGRNEDSGTRIGALSESQFGVTGTPKQFQLTGSTSSGITGVALYPANNPLYTQPNVSWTAAGHSGYNGGSDVAGALDYPDAGTTLSFASGKSGENSGSSYFIGYLGVTDASSAIAGGGKALTYGGVPFSVAAVQNGRYTFWTYEHSYRLTSLTGTALTVANAVADNVYNTDADIAGNGTHGTGTSTLTAGILDNATTAVLVQRSLNEGGPITNY